MEKLEVLESLKSKISFYWCESTLVDKGLMLVFFFAVSWKAFASVIIVLTFLLVVFLTRISSSSLRKIGSPRSVTFWMFLFFMWHLAGMLWANNMLVSYESVMRKLSLVAFPIILVCGNRRMKIQLWIDWIIDVLCLLSLLLIANSILKSVIHLEDNHWAYFFESEYSSFLHRSYWATYCAIASAWSLHQFLCVKGSAWRLFTFLVLAISVLLTVSKAGVLLFFVLSAFAMAVSFSMSFRWKDFIVAIVALLGFLILFVFVPQIFGRFTEVSHALTTVKSSNNMSVESNAARVIMWKSSIDVICSNGWMGSGTGQVKEALYEKNIELNNQGVASERLDSHCQYLNTGVELGLVGMVLLIGILVTGFRRVRNSIGLSHTIMTLAFVLTMMFESFLESQAGIVPFSLLMCLFDQSEEPG